MLTQVTDAKGFPLDDVEYAFDGHIDATFLPEIHQFTTSEDGSVTVDWVILTAAIAGLGIGIISAIELTMSDVSDEMNADMAIATDISDLADGAPAPSAP